MQERRTYVAYLWMVSAVQPRDNLCPVSAHAGEVDAMVERRGREFRLDDQLRRSCKTDIYAMCSFFGVRTPCNSTALPRLSASPLLDLR